ncbi:MAG: hypothetical protein MK008_08675 [Bdellovibrionales bacterium]|nr:hypothetical protein [Bdellovibrionales bacterium]
MSLAENLMDEKPQAQEQKVSETKAPMTDNNVTDISVASSSQDTSAVESLSQQLDDLYKDIEYLTDHFPNHNIRSLTDFAKSLQGKMSNMKAGDVEAKDHGIIPGQVIAKISSLTQEEANQHDVGIVEVDDTGKILLYNKYEQELAGIGLENAKDKNFFTQVAPCTNNRLFMGTFKSGVQSGALDKSFNYTFTYKIKPTPVTIHLYKDAETQRNFIFVKKR